ncbi:MAG: alpha/beta fold hydrolase [Gemmatimonadota bacterium]
MTEPPSHLAPALQRPGETVAQRILAAGFNSVGRFSPGLAARAAEAIFVKSARPRPRPEEAEFLATARPFTVTAVGQRISGYHWGDSGRLVLCAHGWWSHAGRFALLGSALRDAGFQVVALDAAGHGRSSGWRSSMPEFAASIRAVADHAGALHAIVGHSLGGSASLFAIDRGLPTTRAVTIASPASLSRWAQDFREMARLSDPVFQLMIGNMERRLGLSWADLDITAAARRIDIPGLVIQDTDDPDVSPADGEALAAAWRGASLLRTKGLGHRAILRDPEVITQVVEFVGR